MADGGAKVFLGGIASHTTKESIIEYFQQFGAISDAVAMQKPDGTPRGFGFVTFEDAEIGYQVLQMGHIIDGKQVEPKPADGNRPTGGGGGGGGGG
eukprot:CAMPEP_0195078700 /NCGR_PEP_ID=MMETSP0448-20130528/20816_1 /TAXON_ID=66468 /ORGANISM="Heterocapsa triquestra, Strain CCMP 448" /LENGTH=95 /DNA_ID=CAMNT_0040111455 /DNA_START=37 /DNA_END=321 /DNA_ORIENTATION=-